jgi:hypothetical protein
VSALRREKRRAAQQQTEKPMKLDLLPSGWKLWHPVVFGLLAALGAKLADPVMSAVQNALHH